MTPDRKEFQSWVIEQGGPSNVAAMIGASVGAVNRWYYQYSIPSVSSMTKLIEVSNGRLCYNKIIDSLLPLVKN